MINEDGCSQINTNLTEKEGYEWIKKAQISVPLQWGSCGHCTHTQKGM